MRGRHATGNRRPGRLFSASLARGQNSLGSTYNLLALAAADEIQTAKSSIEVQIYTNQTRHQHIAPHDEFPVCYRPNRRATIRMIIPGAVNRRDTIVD